MCSATVACTIHRAVSRAFRSGQTDVVPVAATGQVTGGGQAGYAVFGLTAKADARGTKGECTVVDQSTGTKAKCLTATTYVQSGNHATIIGSATVNGAAATYRIDVTDKRRARARTGLLQIQTSVGYSAGGVLTEGNIQLHG